VHQAEGAEAAEVPVNGAAIVFAGLVRGVRACRRQSEGGEGAGAQGKNRAWRGARCAQTNAAGMGYCCFYGSGGGVVWAARVYDTTVSTAAALVDRFPIGNECCLQFAASLQHFERFFIVIVIRHIEMAINCHENFIGRRQTPGLPCIHQNHNTYNGDK
jgi:hypothetical protein